MMIHGISLLDHVTSSLVQLINGCLRVSKNVVYDVYEICQIIQ